MQKLRIHQQNCRHSAAAQSHFLSLHARTAADVFLIQEPYLYKGNLTAVPREFLAFHADQQKGVRAAIVAHRLLNPIAQVNQVWGCWVQVDLVSAGGTVAAGHCPPKDDLEHQLNLFTTTATTSFTPTRRWKLLGADINAYHEVWGKQPDRNSEQRNALQWKRGLAMQQWIVKHGGQLLNDPNTITFCSDRSSTSAIDITLWWTNTTHFSPSWQIQVHKHLSDHYPITTAITITEQQRPREERNQDDSRFPYPPRRPRKLRQTEEQWSAQRTALRVRCAHGKWPAKTETVEHKAKWLHQQLGYVWPPKPASRLSSVKKHPWWTSSLNKARRQYWRAQRKVRIGNVNSVSSAFFQDKTTDRSRYRKQLRIAQKNSWANFLLELHDPWGAYYKFLRGSRQRRLPLLTAEPNDSVPITPKQFLGHFTAQLRKTERTTTSQSAHTERRGPVTPPTLTPAELDRAIQETATNKAAGPDGFPPLIFHKCADILQPFLLHLYSQCLQTSQFPTSWKAGDAFLLPKAGRENKAMCHWKDFRVITLLPVAGKIFERILLNRLQAEDQLAGRQFPLQHGFRRGRSCQTALFHFINSIQDYMSRGLVTAAIFFDIAGAFDTVPHRTLIRVLEEGNYSQPLRATIESYLKDRLTRFTLHTATVLAPVQRGTPQGGVLSPYLWNVYINSLLSQDWVTNGVSVQAYADDVVIWTAAVDGETVQDKLQEATYRLELWGQRKAMNFQPDKTRMMVFRYRGPLPAITVKLQGITIQTTRSFKYLGLNVDARHCWLPHLKGLIPRINAVACRFLPTVRAVRPVPRAVARRIYAAAALPVLLYGYGIWGSAAARRGVTKLLNRATRPFLLALAHAPSSTATNILHKLVALPDTQTLGDTQAVWLVATTPDLRQLYLVPWAATPVNDRRLKGQPLRKHIYSLLDKNASTLHQLTCCAPIACGHPCREVTVTDMCQTLAYTRNQSVQRRWRDGNWMLTSWHHARNGESSIIIHYEPPNHSTDTAITTQHQYAPSTRLPIQFLLALSNHLDTIPQIHTPTKRSLLLMLQAPTMAIARSSAALVSAHWGILRDRQTLPPQSNTLQIQLYSATLPPPHMRWKQLAQQHHYTTCPDAARPSSRQLPTNNNKALQQLALLRRQLKQANHASIAPEQHNNRIFKEFFPNVMALRMYAITDKLSWALGHLVTNQHPLRDHLHRTNRATTAECPVCQLEAETVEHFLFHCQKFNTQRQVWQRKWAAAITAFRQTRTETLAPPFTSLQSHTLSPHTLRALDVYVNETKRFFNPVWLAD